MKTRFCILLCWFLLIVPLASLAADSEAFSSVSVFSSSELERVGAESNDIIPSNGVAYGDGTIYGYFNNMEVYAYSKDGLQLICRLPSIPQDIFENYAEDEVGRQLLNETVTYIVARDNELFGFNIFSGKYGLIDAEGINWQEKTLDFSCITPDKDMVPERVVRCFLTDEHLFTFVAEINYETWEEDYALYSFRLTDGSSTRYSLSNPVNLCMMDDRNFLVLQRDNKRYSLCQLDTQTNQTKPLQIEMPNIISNSAVCGLAFDETEQNIYLYTNNQVWRSYQYGALRFVDICPPLL